MMIQAVLSNHSHPEYGVATIPFPIPHDQYAHCMELLAALEIGDAAKADCKVEDTEHITPPQRFGTSLWRLVTKQLQIRKLLYCVIKRFLFFYFFLHTTCNLLT